MGVTVALSLCRTLRAEGLQKVGGPGSGLLPVGKPKHSASFQERVGGTAGFDAPARCWGVVCPVEVTQVQIIAILYSSTLSQMTCPLIYFSFSKAAEPTHLGF